MWWLSYTVLLIIVVQREQHVSALDPFDPYKANGASCTSSMPMCAFELRTTSTMTMFYKNLFRVVANENGTLSNYKNASQTFLLTDVITADGYPKLVRYI